MSGLVLIASYPKSGNTWMRAFLASLQLGGRAFDINADLDAIRNLASRELHDAVMEMECSDLTMEEIARLRPHVSRELASMRPGLFKIHDANMAAPGMAEPAIPPDAIDRVVYIVRDPRDVAVSAGPYFGKPLEAIIEDMNDPSFQLDMPLEKLSSRVPQRVSSWSENVRSWLDAPGLKVHGVRYEDMLDSPEETFGAVCRFLDMPASVEDIARSIHATRFERLAELEAAAGFKEHPDKADAPFFRQGRAGGWRQALPEPLAERIARDHGPMMRRLGYL